MFHIAVKRVGSRETAEDLVQETLLAGMEGLPSLSSRTTHGLRAWLCRILQNKISDHFRKKAVQKEEVFLEDTEWAGHWKQDSAPRPWMDPVAILLQKELKARLRECLGMLALTSQRAFRLREIGGLSAERTAARLGVSRENLYVILHRARLALRSCLETTYASRGIP